MIRERILELINSELLVDNFDVNADIQKTYDVDSISLLDFIMTIEEEFGIEISDTELSEISTANQIIELVELKKGK